MESDPRLVKALVEDKGTRDKEIARELLEYEEYLNYNPLKPHRNPIIYFEKFPIKGHQIDMTVSFIDIFLEDHGYEAGLLQLYLLRGTLRSIVDRKVLKEGGNVENKFKSIINKIEQIIINRLPNND